MPVGKNKGGKHKVTDPRKNLASTANTDKKKKVKERTMQNGKGATISVSDKSTQDARKGKGNFKKPEDYKGKSIKSESGKMAGYKTHDGKYTRTAEPVSRRKGKAALAKDKKLHSKKSADKTASNTRFKNAKLKG